MENLMMDILDEVLDLQEDEKEVWKVTNDEEADWWIEIHEEKLAEIRRLKMQLENKIAFYKEKLDKVIKEEEAIIERRSEEHTSELQSRPHLVCRLLLEKKKSTI